MEEQDLPLASAPLDWTQKDDAFRRIVWMASAPLDPIDEDEAQPTPG